MGPMSILVVMFFSSRMTLGLSFCGDDGCAGIDPLANFSNTTTGFGSLIPELVRTKGYFLGVVGTGGFGDVFSLFASIYFLFTSSSDS